MVQSDDGNWYAYVASSQGIADYNLFDGGSDDRDIQNIYGFADGMNVTAPKGFAEDTILYANVSNFLDDAPDPNKFEEKLDVDTGATHAANAFYMNYWPYIQAFELEDGESADVDFGRNTVELEYDYADKDISFDRTSYPLESDIVITLEDTLLNLSPTDDGEEWTFFDNGTIVYSGLNNSNTLIEDSHRKAIGFETGPLSWDKNARDNLDFVGGNYQITVYETDDGFVNEDDNDMINLRVKTELTNSNLPVLEYDSKNSIRLGSSSGSIAFDDTDDKWLPNVELGITLVDEDRNISSLEDDDFKALPDDGEEAMEVPYISIGNPIHVFDMSVGGITTLSSTDSKVFEVRTANITKPNSTDNPYDPPAVPYSELEIKVMLDLELGDDLFHYASYDMSAIGGPVNTPVSYTHLTLPTKRIV